MVGRHGPRRSRTRPIDIYFDVAATGGRLERALQAIAAGKHIYLEKPIASSAAEAMKIVRAAQAAGVKAAAVQDKVYLPGFQKLRKVRDSGFFGRILSARLDAGWWVFDGELYPAQRSSWNYRKKDGGGLVLDMYPHWRYLLASLIGPIKAVSCRKVTQIPRRIDEAGKPFRGRCRGRGVRDVRIRERRAGASHDLVGDAREARRPHPDPDRRHARLGARRRTQCFVQSLAATPKPVWNVEVPQAMNFDAQWQEVPDNEPFKNSYR